MPAETESADQTVIYVSGELDFHTAPELRKQILAAFNDGAQCVVLDLGQLEFIDSSGLSVIVAGFKRFKERGGELRLRALTDRTRKVLEISGLSRVLISEP
ncbi:MAG: STAS domain-containing protein [Actinomycetota bacterium]